MEVFMEIIICENYDEMSKIAAEKVAKVVLNKADCTLGLATGSTPIGTYKKLIEKYNAGELDFSRVKTFNLDEYYPISPKNENSYRYFMEENLFGKVNINADNVSFPKGDAEDVSAECKRYEKQIAESEGIDIQILGIGQNGHIGFNEPAEALELYVHKTDLEESTIAANARFFESEADVPRQAITMGIADIMSARQIILLANGKGKHKAISALLDDTISASVPATFIKLHKNVCIICDKEAYYG